MKYKLPKEKVNSVKRLLHKTKRLKGYFMKKLSVIMLIVVTIIILLVALPLLAPRILANFGQNRQSSHTVVAPSNSTVVAPSNSTVVSDQQGTQPGPLISRNVPAFASSGYTPASNANDASYDTTWRSHGASAWLAYNLSSVPASKRSKVLAVWYNDSSNYDHTLIGYPTYNVPQDYTIDVNSAVGGSQPPTSGWATQVKVQGNHYHSRQHVIDMSGYSWIRIKISAIDGSIQNYDASINLDIYDANTALNDDWIFFGDSITDGGMGHSTIDGVQSFAQLIHEKAPSYYPVQENGGIGYLTSTEALQHLNTWLGLFPGKYVALDYGTNDALGCVGSDGFYSRYVQLVHDVVSAGKIPVVSRIPWGRDSHIQTCVPPLNAMIDKLYSAFPQIIRGPDLWTFFKSHQNLISGDNKHPSSAGFSAYRQQWANTMLAKVYAHQ
jgi:hypothetical protein